MKLCLLLLACAQVRAYPYHGNYDTVSYGSSASNRGGMVISRYYNPYYNPRAVGSGMAAFMFKPEEQYPQSSQYYVPDRRRQTPQENYIPQQNEVLYSQVPERPTYPEQTVYEQPALPELPAVTTELAEPIDKVEVQTTTLKTLNTPEITEPETEEVQKPVTPRKRVTKKKVQTIEEDEEEGNNYPPGMPSGAYFPMFFGWGGRSGGAPGGATAIANAFSTGRGGVATSHATAYGQPRPDDRS